MSAAQNTLDVRERTSTPSRAGKMMVLDGRKSFTDFAVGALVLALAFITVRPGFSGAFSYERYAVVCKKQVHLGLQVELFQLHP